MKKLFIYYSLTGNGDLVAKELKLKGYETRKVEVRKELPKSFILKILTGGFKAMINYKDKLVDFDKNISNYDEIVIGSPIWNSRLSSPINTVLKELDLKDKRVSFIFYSGSGEDNKATSIVKEKYDANVINLKEPLKNQEELDKLKDK